MFEIQNIYIDNQFDFEKDTPRESYLPCAIDSFTDEELQDINEFLFMYDSSVNEQEIQEVLWFINQSFSQFDKLYYLLVVFNKENGS